MLDVYDALVERQQVYVKVKIVKTHAHPPRIVTRSSFKRNEYHERTVH